MLVKLAFIAIFYCLYYDPLQNTALTNVTLPNQTDVYESLYHYRRL